MLQAALDFVAKYGFAGFLLIVLLLIIQDPDRAVKLQAIFISPVFRLCKWGSKRYIASEVAYTTSHFFKNHVSRLTPAIATPNLKIRWVSSPTDPVFEQDGTLILRLQETEDQTHNVLTATRVALPHLVCASARHNLDRSAQCAIDLTILRSLADRLGKHARPIFQRYFLGPETAEDKRAAQLFEQLVKIDQSGTFVAIFLEELNNLGDYLFSAGDTSDKTNHVAAFIQYLLGLATREVGQYIELDYVSEYFKVGIMLLAISRRAQTEGLPPYVNRIDKKIKLGCDSIYIAAFPRARSFLGQLTKILDADPRICLVKAVHIANSITPGTGDRGLAHLVLYRRNSVFTDTAFADTVKNIGLQEGTQIEGTVIDVAQTSAMVDIGGLFCVVSIEESSWISEEDCRNTLQEGGSYQFLVKTIDYDRGAVFLTRRLPHEDPWLLYQAPVISQVIQCQVRFLRGANYVCATPEGIEVQLPTQETSWAAAIYPSNDPVGSTLALIVTQVDQRSHTITASLRQLDADPWPKIEADLPRGTILGARVLEIRPDGVRVHLANGLPAYVPRQYVEEGGRSFAQATADLRPGTPVRVKVNHVFVAKRKIRVNFVGHPPTSNRPV
jgi:hypothetical protein